METTTARDDKVFVILLRVLGAGGATFASIVAVTITGNSACAAFDGVAVGIVAAPIAAIVAGFLPRTALINWVLLGLAILAPIAAAFYGHTMPMPGPGDCAF